MSWPEITFFLSLPPWQMCLFSCSMHVSVWIMFLDFSNISVKKEMLKILLMKSVIFKLPFILYLRCMKKTFPFHLVENCSRSQDFGTLVCSMLINRSSTLPAITYLFFFFTETFQSKAKRLIHKRSRFMFTDNDSCRYSVPYEEHDLLC